VKPLRKTSDPWALPNHNNSRGAVGGGRSKEPKKLGKILSTRFTIMVLPHDDQKPFRFHINVFLLGLLGFGLTVVALGFFYFSTVFSGLEQVNVEKAATLAATQTDLDSVLDEVKELLKVYQVFQGTLGKTLNELDIESNSASPVLAGSGDLSRLVDIQEMSGTDFRELIDIKRLSTSLAKSVQPLSQIGEVLRSQKSLLANLPNHWPVGGGQGIVTMHFGPTIHPFLYNWYIHKGLDIAGPIGLPIVAAANGRVVESRFDPNGYGNFVIIEHKYGFRTRYAHMNTRLVEPGMEVTQGQRIGTLGSTGFSTGPHCHFELILGTQVLDPWPFLQIKSEFDSWEASKRNDR
jgi:murein DD-endopeptidase MepM/ murein hydrolase activator NlpD